MTARRGKLAPALAVTLIAIAVCYLVVRTALAELSPVNALTLPPVDLRPAVRAHALQALHPEHHVDGRQVAMARRGALSAPLSHTPFLIQAKAAEQAGDIELAARLLEEARQRRANFAPARLQLLIYYARLGRYRDAFAEVDTVLRLSPEASRLLLPEMVKLLQDPRGRSALAAVLVTDPPWKEAFFQTAHNQPVRPEHAVALLNAVRHQQQNYDAHEELELVVSALVRAGEVGSARRYWLSSLSPDARAAAVPVFNGNFAPMAQEGIFAWNLADSEVGRAEMRGGDGERRHLEVNYFGGSSVILAEQLVSLPAGEHRLRYAARTTSELASNEIYWTVLCYSGGRELGRSRVSQLTSQYSVRETRFTVPASGCDGQRLRLVAEPGEISMSVSLQIADLEVTR